MSLHSRIQVATNDGPETEGAATQEAIKSAPERSSVVTDPFGELKTRVHNDIIAPARARGCSTPTTTTTRPGGDGNEAVAEVLALEKTPLTRQERARITREITDDILGYGPLEPFLRDDTITEVMVNDHAHDLHRAARQDHAHERAVRRRRSTCCASSTRSSAASAAASTRPRRWSTRACPTARA